MAGSLRGRVGTEHPAGLRDLEGRDALRLAARYLRSFEHPEQEFERVVDRGPDNPLFLGLLALVLPNARVVHVRRDPRDSCVTSWFTHFGAHQCTFACDLERLAARHEDHQRLMAHWASVTRLRTFELDYEELCAHPEPTTRALTGFLELEWDEACAAFERPRSVGSWRSYEQQLGALGRLRG